MNVRMDSGDSKKRVMETIYNLRLDGNAMLLPDCNFSITPLVVSGKYASLIKAD